MSWIWSGIFFCITDRCLVSVRSVWGKQKMLSIACTMDVQSSPDLPYFLGEHKEVRYIEGHVKSGPGKSRDNCIFKPCSWKQKRINMQTWFTKMCLIHNFKGVISTFILITVTLIYHITSDIIWYCNIKSINIFSQLIV